MADKKAQAKAAKSEESRNIVVNTQYVKDLSFENPLAPASLVAPKAKPNIDLSIDIKAQALQEKTFEVVLHITAKAALEDKPLFIVDLAYAGIFTLNAIEDKDKEPVLLVYCPNMLFPFARRIIADVTRDGGFPPLMMDPVDFFSLYQRKQDQSPVAKEQVAAE